MREAYEIQVQCKDDGTFVAVVTLSRGGESWTGKSVPLEATTWDEANEEAYANEKRDKDGYLDPDGPLYRPLFRER